MGPRCTWLFLFVLVCVTDSIKGFFRCRGYWSILLSICCVYIYICSAGSVELLIVLLYLLRCLVYHMLSKTRRNSGNLHRVIGEVLVLGLLVVVYKIPCRSCIFNTAVVLEPGTMVCVYHTAVYLVHRILPDRCHICSWFLPMSWILDLSILLSICCAYIYVWLGMPSYLLFCCIYA